MIRVRTIAVVVASSLTLAGCAGSGSSAEGGATVVATPEDDESQPDGTGDPRVVGTIAQGLTAPWGVDFLPDGSAVVTERDTRRVLRVTAEGDVTEIGTIDAAAPAGEGGLLGVAVSPSYDEDRTLFLYVTTSGDNRVVRATYDVDDPDAGLGEPEVVLDGIPNGFIHDGGRLEFGPDGHLYVSTGETGEPSLAQDRESLGGKVLRITSDGSPAEGNPDPDSPVWSWGHRNIQGLAFDDAGTLWASEFGDSTWDELNRVESGRNYGWPEVEGQGDREEFADPQVVWSTDDASPSGLAYLDGHVWMAALRGQRLWRVDVSTGEAQQARDFFVGRYGRMRTVAVAPDGRLWVTTSNRDGRGEPAEADDRILVVDVS